MGLVVRGLLLVVELRHGTEALDVVLDQVSLGVDAAI